MPNVDEIMSMGRLIARQKSPYFTTALLSLIPTPVQGMRRADGGVATMGITADLLLLYSEEYVATLSFKQAGAVLWHETMHVILDAHGRRQGRHPTLWNIAQDLYINDQGRTMGLEFPPGVLYPEQFGLAQNLTSDEYYAALQKQAETKSVEDVVQVVSDQQAPGPDGAPRWNSGQCGSGAGRPLEGEPEGSGEGSEGEGRSAAEVQRVRVQVAKEIAEASKRDGGRGRGSMPLGLDRWADSFLEPPKVDWRVQLARAIRTAVAYRPGAVDLRFSRRSRRQAGLGFGAGRPVLPGFVAPVPRVWFILDTSGSMSVDQVRTGVSECAAVLTSVGAEVTFGSCDAGMHALGRVRTPGDLAGMVKGGGGTDFRPALEAAMASNPRPEVVIFCTDGDGPAPATPPPFTTIWLLVDHYRDPAPWGERVIVSAREKKDGSPVGATSPPGGRGRGEGASTVRAPSPPRWHFTRRVRSGRRLQGVHDAHAPQHDPGHSRRGDHLGP